MSSTQPPTVRSTTNHTVPCCHRTLPDRFFNHVVKNAINRIIYYLINPFIELLNRQGFCHLKSINEFDIHPVAPEVPVTPIIAAPEPQRAAIGYQCPMTGQYYESLSDYLGSGYDAEEAHAQGEETDQTQRMKLEKVRYDLDRIRHRYCEAYGSDAWDDCNIEIITSDTMHLSLDGRHYRLIKDMAPVLNNVFKYVLEIVTYLEGLYPDQCHDDFKKNVRYFKDRGRFFLVPRHEIPNALLVRMRHAVCNVDNRLHVIESILDDSHSPSENADLSIEIVH